MVDVKSHVSSAELTSFLSLIIFSPFGNKQISAIFTSKNIQICRKNVPNLRKKSKCDNNKIKSKARTNREV